MKKAILVLLGILIIVTITGTGLAAQPDPLPDPNQPVQPFAALWSAMGDLADRITALESSQGSGVHLGYRELLYSSEDVFRYESTAATDGFVYVGCSNNSYDVVTMAGGAIDEDWFGNGNYAYMEQIRSVGIAASDRTWKPEAYAIMPVAQGEAWRVWGYNCEVFSVKWRPLSA